MDEGGSITTLGRGGSDTSAVALAAFLNADACEIYTDVEGVFTNDPGICADAKKLTRISYDEMIELASTGAKVLEIRSVEFAKKFSVPVHVRSTFIDTEGTWLVKEDETMNDVLVSGVACDKNEAKITLLRVPDRPGLAAQIFGPIADAHIVVDMIIQNASEDGTTDMTFTVSTADHKKALLWDQRFAYVDRITEIEGYAVAVEEGRRLGMSDAEVVRHLSNPWMTEADVQRLAAHIARFLDQS